MSIEQDIAGIRDSVPHLWWGVYQGCLQAGFDERQAFALVETFILSSFSGGIRPPDVSGPNNNTGE